MVCQASGVEFSNTKVDRFFHSGSNWDEPLEDETYCSEVCANDRGWYGTEDTSARTAALVAALISTVVRDLESDRIFDAAEIASLNDTLAIVRFESGAERKAGPPVTLPLLLASLYRLPTADGFSFWPATLAQLEDTLYMLG